MGAAQQNISQEIIRKIKILKPDNNIITNFNNITIDIFNEIKLLQQKNEKLRTARNRLLPKLISGKLSVEHLVKIKSK